MKLTETEVLVAVSKAIRPWSAYIIDVIDRQHAALIRAGGKGFAPRRSLVLARLKKLASYGYLERSHGTNGYYGYHWKITEVGRRALEQSQSQEGK